MLKIRAKYDEKYHIFIVSMYLPKRNLLGGKGNSILEKSGHYLNQVIKINITQNQTSGDNVSEGVMHEQDTGSL